MTATTESNSAARIRLKKEIDSPRPEKKPNLFERPSAVFPVQQILHRLTPGGVGAFVALQRIGRCSARILFLAARRTAIRKPGLPRPQLKLFPTLHTSFNRICHCI